MSRAQGEGRSESLPFPSSPATSSPSGVARSPSHESFATDLSLMSLSSLGFRPVRPGSAAGPDSGDELRRSPVVMDGGVGGWVTSRSAKISRGAGLLQVPPEQYGSKARGGSAADDVLYEEENEAIRNCGALSSMLGLMRSFSTSDLDQNVLATSDTETLRASVSEMVLNSWKHYDMPYGRLEYTSRSCSTWVAVGDISTTSQLPSPQTLAGYAAEHPEMTAIDFVRAINKKVRQMYIRRRLESTYKALERLTRSELCLDLPSIAVPVPGGVQDQVQLPQFHISTELDRSIRHELLISSVGFHGANKTLSLTVKDIERDKGKPLSKYERNIMIFNWLQSLDENAFDQLA
ncbi:uncharacterized protein LOC129218302 [Uloborus diversus]|uniref:uncharacterized protein LOC129218302 n=1 Tax=Uloborus diversus TaxID=327109 RepID=UPI002408F25F|nr:uncharacterized protein LOC129218302 [Uloborus diversus]